MPEPHSILAIVENKTTLTECDRVYALVSRVIFRLLLSQLVAVCG